MLALKQARDRIGQAIALLQTCGRVRMEMRDSGGRPVEVWFAKAGYRHG